MLRRAKAKIKARNNKFILFEDLQHKMLCDYQGNIFLQSYFFLFIFSEYPGASLLKIKKIFGRKEKIGPNY